MHRPLRSLLACLAALLVLAGASCAATAAPEPEAETKGWNFVDDRGETITAPAVPKRIVAYTSSAGALWDLGIKAVGTFGPLSPVDGKPNPQAGNVVPAEVTNLGEEYGQADIEKLASLQPDLIVYGTWSPDAELTDEEKKMAEIAPMVKINHGKGATLDKTIARYAELAASLGVDLNSPELSQDKADFEAASNRLRDWAKTKPDLRITAVALATEMFYIAVPKDNADLAYYSSLGLNLVSPDNPNNGEFWEYLSWENADKYAADVIMWDTRSQALKPEQAAKEKASFAKLPAVETKQLVRWDYVSPPSYKLQSTVLNTLADELAPVSNLTRDAPGCCRPGGK
ncbi:ABC transporter substrate-binding protein [Microlunatus speluncae]|uniref:ABC transporter substrate-binding protein n=1 Tax=Microlunatus speluncae TaxID=2594267 RepID=UPI0012660C5D|nr:ABC transporter substrate-binding protein [Microlunatus speluncae]